MSKNERVTISSIWLHELTILNDWKTEKLSACN